MDDITPTAENQGGEVAPTAEAPTAEQQATQNQSQPGDTTGVDSKNPEAKGNSGHEGADGSEGDGDGRARPSRAQRRIHELSSQLREAREQAKPTQGEGNGDALDGIKLPDFTGRESVTPEEINKSILDVARQIVDKRFEQHDAAQAVDQKVESTLAQMDSDAEQAIKDYAVLDPNSEEFNQDLSDDIFEDFYDKVRLNPELRLNQFVEKKMQLYGHAKKEGAVEAAKNLSTRQSSGALRPGASRKDKAPEDMTIAELEQNFSVR